MMVCKVVVYSMVVFLVVRELTAAIDVDCVVFSGIFRKGDKF